jgi:hypothetical protein
MELRADSFLPNLEAALATAPVDLVARIDVTNGSISDRLATLLARFPHGRT